MESPLSRGHAETRPYPPREWSGRLDVLSCGLPLGATGRGPEPGSGLAVGHPEGLGLDAGEDIVTLEPCGRTEVGDRGDLDGNVQRVVHDALSRLICADWLPQDGVSAGA